MSKLTDYKPLTRNPNKGTQRGTGILEQSVRELGAGRSILVDKNGVILAGNHAQEAFVNAGIDDVIEVQTDGKKIVVVKRTDLDADSSAGKKMAIMDNRTSEQGLAWDAVVVEDLLNEIKDDEGELDAYLESLAKDTGAVIGDEPPEDQGAQIDKAEELRVKWGVELGQLWQLGEHRLICGDCTDKAVVDRVMSGKKASITFTSPPYNAGVSAKLRGNTSIDDNLYKDEYDDNKSQPEYLELLTKFTDLCFDVSEYQFINIQVLAGNKKAFLEYWYKYSDKFADVAIWDKQHAAPAAALRVMDSRFEFVLIFSKQANRAIGTNNFRGMVHNVYSGNPQRHNDYAASHAATFPVDFPEYFIEHFTNKNEFIYEPFCGTGTVIIACERLNRKCRAIEISPAYCAVAIQRWVDMTGQEPVLLDK